MTEASPKDKTGVSNRLGWLLAALAATALAVTNVKTLHESWCQNVGIFCALPVVSAPMEASSGGTAGPYSKDAKCRESNVPLCVRPTTSRRKLDVGSGKFVATSTVGRYDNGLPLNDPAIATWPSDASPQVGWYPKSDSASEICVQVFTRTGACEVLVSIKGRLEATEHIDP